MKKEMIVLTDNVLVHTSEGKIILERGDKIQFEATDTTKIKVKNPGVLNIPEGKNFWDMPLSHFINLAKTKGKKEISAAINNLVRWNKNDNPSISKKASAIMNKLKNNKEWQNIAAKSTK